MRAERPILLRFLNVLSSLNDFIIKRITGKENGMPNLVI
jgi:hypothetical protein